MIAQISCCMTLNIGNTYLSRSGIIAVTIGIQACPFLVALGRIHPEDAKDKSKSFELFMFSCFTQPPVHFIYEASQRDETRDNHINHKASDSQITFKSTHKSNA